MNTPIPLLNNLTPTQFLSEYWQKKPLLIRQAIPNFSGLLTPNELAGLACEEDVESRIVEYKRKQWHLRCGPFEEEDFLQLPEKNWTLLVQSLNHHLPEAAELLQQFNFIPYARLDDLMVSYAPEGGGVGPHFDSYDVFLLQGSGKRMWRISDQTDLALVEGAPLRILKNFDTIAEWVLEPGDMLYLPPKLAHWGIAVGDDCMTYSIGFRAPKTQELASEFLSFLQERLQLDGMYQDPSLALQAHPAEIGADMVQQVTEMLQQVRWDSHDVGSFLAAYLSEPKPHVVYEPPRKISQEKFQQLLASKTLHLDVKSQMLFYNHCFYLNGEQLEVENNLVPSMQKLADMRSLRLSDMNWSVEENAVFSACLYEAYLAGWLYFD